MQQVGITADEAKEELEAVWDTDPDLELSDEGTFRLGESDGLDFDSDSDNEEYAIDSDEVAAAKQARLHARFKPFGPPGVLVAGFREHELGMVSFLNLSSPVSSIEGAMMPLL